MTDLRPLGAFLPDWQPPSRPARLPICGTYADLEPLTLADHGADLWAAFSSDQTGTMWDYLPDGPFASVADMTPWLEACAQSMDPLFFAARDKDSGRVTGFLSFLRINPAAGSIEVGYITFSPLLQKTRAASEAVMLTAKTAFALGYRRFEWKCNALNQPSRRAAERYGFSYEGVFRQAAIVKGRNRDTAWFAMIDAEWPQLLAAYDAWLDPENFDAKGRQRRALSDLTRPVLGLRDPSLS